MGHWGVMRYCIVLYSRTVFFLDKYKSRSCSNTVEQLLHLIRINRLSPSRRTINMAPERSLEGGGLRRTTNFDCIQNLDDNQMTVLEVESSTSTSSTPKNNSNVIPVRYVFTVLISIGLAIIYGLKVSLISFILAYNLQRALIQYFIIYFTCKL